MFSLLYRARGTSDHPLGEAVIHAIEDVDVSDQGLPLN
jgi:hypothetical protein